MASGGICSRREWLLGDCVRGGDWLLGEYTSRGDMAILVGDLVPESLD